MNERGVSCYMPKSNNTILLPGISRSRLVTFRRMLLSITLKLLQPVLLGDVDPSFDDAITVSTLTGIGSSDNDNHFQLPNWLQVMKHYLKKLNLCAEPVGFDEEEKEERRRFALTLSPAIPANQFPAQALVGGVYDRSSLIFLLQFTPTDYGPRVPHVAETLAQRNLAIGYLSGRVLFRPNWRTINRCQIQCRDN